MTASVADASGNRDDRGAGDPSITRWARMDTR
jgi:hypothetical protein